MNTARNTIKIDELFNQTKEIVEKKNQNNVVQLNNSLLPENNNIIEQPEITQPVKPERVIEKNESYLTNEKAPTKPTAFMWIKNVIIGAGHTYYERLSMFINPISFIVKNISIITTGLFYVSLPVLLSFYFLYSFPEYRTSLITGGFSQFVSMFGLYAAFAIISTFAILFIRTLSLGLVRMLNNFAAKGYSVNNKR